MSTINDLNSSFIIELLFEEEIKRPTAGAVLHSAKKAFGDIEAITRNNDITSFAVKNYTAYKEDNKFEPVMLGMGKVVEFKQKNMPLKYLMRVPAVKYRSNGPLCSYNGLKPFCRYFPPASSSG